MRGLSLLPFVFVLASCQEGPGRTDRALSADGRLVAMSGGAGGATHACFTCHGLDGEGDGVSVPRLAGLDAGYLHKQMEDYATGLRADPVMGPVAKALSDADQRAVSAYYAGIVAPTRAAAPATPPLLWTQGDPARGLAPCAACHGANGEGVGPGNPALAGQPAAYTIEQMKRWKAAKRRNDARSVMTTVAARLTEAEIAALAAWSQTRPASPAPASDAASASASGEASARSAASREGRRLDRRNGA